MTKGIFLLDVSHNNMLKLVRNVFTILNEKYR